MPPSVPRRTLLQGLGASAAALGLGLPALAGGRRPNVLFVAIDDLNDWTGTLGGHVQARTPHLDRLVKRGVSFTNAHCAAPLCNPSRTALLTGRRPATTGVYGNEQPLRRAWPEALTLPQHFHRSGYEALGAGKIFHYEDPRSWTEAWPDACSRPPDKPGADAGDRGRNVAGLHWGPTRVDRDNVLSDGQVAHWATRVLGRTHDDPFFLGVGLFKPHLPWHVPARYYELYPLDRIVLPVVPPDDLDDVPEAGRRLAHLETHRKIVERGAWAEAVQAYLASLSYADAMLGLVLDALDASPHRQDTLVVLWSDHGWSLGEKFHWKKSALWEECTRVPFVIAGPGVQRATCDRPVNLLDVFPTLVELCDLPVPAGLEGQSLVPLLHDPTRAWERPSLTTHGRGNHALRGQDLRYIRYADGSEELYDHRVDPGEWRNLAADPRYQDEKAALAAWLPRTDADGAPQGKARCHVGPRHEP